MKLALFLLTTVAFANKKVVAEPVAGVTAEQIRDATDPINIATFTHNDGSYGVKCAGSEDKLRCEIWDRTANKVLIRSNDLKICKVGNSAAIMSEELGLKGHAVALPGVIKGSKRPDCEG